MPTELKKKTTVSFDVRQGMGYLFLKGEKNRPFILNPDSMSEIEDVIESIVEEPSALNGLIIHGQDDGIFCAGADLDVLANCDDTESISQLIRRGQTLMTRISQLPITTVAAIDGSCVGGGLELALACDIRVATDNPKTKLGLPEVRLGILPAWGGTTRLSKIVGLKNALPLLLTGRLVSGRRARDIGLISECCPRELVLERSRHWAKEMTAARHHGHHSTPMFRRIGISDYVIEEWSATRNFALDMAEKQARKQTGGNYPAPMAILQILRDFDGKDLQGKLDLEHDAALKLAKGGVAKHLISIFRRNRDADRGAPYDAALQGAGRMKTVAVIGSGVMGTGIAMTALLAGLDVVVVDPSPEALVQCRQRIQKDLQRRVKQRRLAPTASNRILDRLMLSESPTDLVGADIIIESVPEIMELKKEVLATAVEHCSKEALICTNTSSLSVAELSKALPGQRRLYGLHFFNPAPKMPLIEIVRGPGATDRGLGRLARFSRRLKKTPVIVEDRPAFVVNRLLAPYLLEAVQLLKEGAPMPSIESAAKSFGLPMGPFELMDSVGLDIIEHVCDYLASFEDFDLETPDLIHRMVEKKQIGKKAGSGFYRWRGAKKKRRSDRHFQKIMGVNPELRDWPERVLIERLTEALSKEADRILKEGIVMNPDDLDLASIFGMGFPPFTGGVATWSTSDSEGAQ